jgi:hypothetical protein
VRSALLRRMSRYGATLVNADPFVNRPLGGSCKYLKLYFTILVSGYCCKYLKMPINILGSICKPEGRCTQLASPCEC